jgi:pyroglutamyl-peptidase
VSPSSNQIARRHLLVTGFEPFDGDGVNPSGEVAKLLDGRLLGDCVVKGLILPVQHEAARARVAPLLEAPGLGAVVHLGLAGGRARIALERVAVNVMDFDTPDNTGYRARNEPCVPGGPPAYFATLPLAVLVEALVADGVPAYVSNTAGTYLCNQTMYGTLHRLAERRHPARAGFVHLPLLPAMVAASGLEQPSMDAALMVRAVEIVVGVVARTA